MSEHPESEGPESEGPESLFSEAGASWLWLVGGPLAASAMLFIQYRAGMGFKPVVPLIFLTLLTVVFTVQVRAARTHTSVELTRDALRAGAETILVSEIIEVYPEAEKTSKSAEPLEKWQKARALGELNGVPKRRRGIGLRLSKGRTAQAWAVDHVGLRAALSALLVERTP